LGTNGRQASCSSFSPSNVGPKLLLVIDREEAKRQRRGLPAYRHGLRAIPANGRPTAKSCPSSTIAGQAGEKAGARSACVLGRLRPSLKRIFRLLPQMLPRPKIAGTLFWEKPSKSLNLLAPRAGFEPATIRLTVECSTAELPRNRANQVRAGQRITKPPSLAKDEMGHAGATPPGNGKALCHDVLSSLFTAQKQRSGSCRCDPAAQPCRQLTANSSQSPITLDVAAFH
jgi:hypothetical protein